MTTLSVRECITFGWRTFKARPWLFIRIGLVILLANIVMSLSQGLFEAGGSLGGDAVAAITGIISAIIGIVVSFLISMGETSFFLRAHDAPMQAGLKDLWRPHPFWKFFAASLLAGIAILLGLVLLIVPGIMIAIVTMFIGYLVIEEGLGPIEAIKKSAALTKGNRWKLFQLVLATIGINILGFMALLVGLFVSVPVSFLAVVHAYRTLRGPAGDTLAASEEEILAVA